MSKVRIKGERGYANILVVALLLLVSIIFVSYLELGQTHLSSSKIFKETKFAENISLSTNRTVVNEIDYLFKNSFPINGIEDDYLLSIENIPSHSFLDSANRINPFFYQSLHDFTDHNYYFELSTTDDNIRSLSFIKELNCSNSSEGVKCRNFIITNVTFTDNKVLDIYLTDVEYHFLQFLDIETDFVTTEYIGYIVNKNTGNKDLIKEYW